MKKLVEKFTQNPYIILVGWLATIVALIAAIVVPILQSKRVILHYSCTTNLLVSNSLSAMEGLDIKYKGNTVDQLSVTTCEIINTGNVTIEDADIYEGHKIRIFNASSNGEVLFATVVSQSSDTNNCQVTYDESGVELHFDVLEQQENVVINIYHTGNAYARFLIEGKIKEGKIKEEKAVIPLNFVFHFIAIIICIVVFTVIYQITNADWSLSYSVVIAIVFIIIMMALFNFIRQNVLSSGLGIIID